MRVLIASALFVICLVATGIRAAEERAPEVIGVCSVASIDRINEFLAQIGRNPIPAPASFERLPIIGPGGIAKNRPIGIMLAGNVPPEHQIVMTFPLTAAAPVADMYARQGFAPVPGNPEVFEAHGLAIRRTDSYCLFGGNVDLLKRAQDKALYGPYNNKKLLAHAAIDIVAARRTRPNPVNLIFEPDPSTAKDRHPAVHAFLAMIRSELDHLDIRLCQEEQDVVLTLEGEPAMLRTAARKLPRPGMPAGCVHRVDVLQSEIQEIKALAALVRSTWGLMNSDPSSLPDPGTAAFCEGLIQALYKTDALSAGVELIDNTTAFYQVNQYRQPYDVVTILRTAVREGKAKAQAPIFAELDTYKSAGGAEVFRLKVGKGGGIRVCFDVVQRGNTAYIVTVKGEAQLMDRLLQAKPDGELSLPAEGWLDAGGALQFMWVNMPNPPIKLSLFQRIAVVGQLKGRRITWQMTPTEKGARLEVRCGMDVLKTIASAWH